MFHPGQVNIVYLSNLCLIIHLQLVVDPELFPGTLGMPLRYTLDGMWVHYKAPLHTKEQWDP